MRTKATRYPYLTAWIGLAVLTSVATFILALAISPIMFLITKIFNPSHETIINLIIPINRFVLGFVAGFFVFKFVIKRHIIGNVDSEGTPIVNKKTENTEQIDGSDS